MKHSKKILNSSFPLLCNGVDDSTAMKANYFMAKLKTILSQGVKCKIIISPSISLCVCICMDKNMFLEKRAVAARFRV